MFKISTMAMTVVTFVATPIFAQEITGAEGSAGFISFLDDDVDTSALAFDAGIQGTIVPKFGLGANIELYTVDDADDSILNGTLHAMYLPSPVSAVGVFVAQQTEGDFETSSYGIEGGFASDNGNIQAYYGIVDQDGIENDVSIAGVELSFDVGQNFALGLKYDGFTIDDAVVLPGDFSASALTINDTSLFASYEFVEGVSAFASIGQVSLSATSGNTVFTSEDDSEYFSIGAEYKFGAGTIFDARGLNTYGN